MKYHIEDLFQSVNDIFYQYDEGEMSDHEASNLMGNCCEAFLNDSNKRNDVKAHLAMSLAFGRGIIDAEQLKQLLTIYKDEL